MKALRLPVLENKNFEIDLLRSYVLTCDPKGKTFLTPGHQIKNRDKGPLLDAYMQNIKALDLPVSEKKSFEDGLLCP